MLGLHKVLNKIFHDRCLIVLWICQGSKNARLPSIMQVSQSFEYSSSFQYARAGVVNGPRLHNIPWTLYFEDSRLLNVLSSEYAKQRFWMYQECICYSYKRFWIKYFIVYMPGFIKKTLYHRCLTGFWIFL